MSAVSDFQEKLFIDNQFVDAAKGATLPVINPSTEQFITEVAAGGEEDIDRAVRSAHRAFEGEWGATEACIRGRLLLRLADLVERDADRIARLESIDNGKVIGMSRHADVPNLVRTLRYFAGYADKLDGRSISVPHMFGRPVLAYTVREPLGVIGAIAAYNAPTMYVGWKAAAALAAGNSVVLKPAEEASLSTLHIASLVLEAGFPAGAFNIVPGIGSVAGSALANHPLLAKLSFTGSGAVGRILAMQASQTLKPLTLELGGKAAQLITDSADLAVAAPILAMGFLANQGQICAAGTRLLVHRSRVDELVERLLAIISTQVIGDALDPNTTLGPVISQRALNRILDACRHGEEEGAQKVCGGRRVDRPGYFVEPSLFVGTNAMSIAREEIFGPVACIIPFDDVDEAVAITNDSPYGLSAGIFTRELSEGHRLARQMRTGAVWINGFGLIDPSMPWGGIKHSGYGQENGTNGLDDVTHEKVIAALL
ncbi:aldehyde dehydrogenase family protein [Pseudomonas extremaustralis]|jgi:acyl-CoA reductase-like NAD-dependent aldehyde dehydrogenase|uniref:aldehyde dehydrogenase family protein n=1 Tax=Pseudomonas extremaustralis TaxID=359110 RepID=UPI0023DEE237|nr:aldehyde dehydrogenase family protein [Pseudomonas extremaustralis]MDF3134535.1 aldehyde dehydrogenase family protein [Pseudomonas extremaustralis]